MSKVQLAALWGLLCVVFIVAICFSFLGTSEEKPSPASLRTSVPTTAPEIRVVRNATPQTANRSDNPEVSSSIAQRLKSGDSHIRAVALEELRSEVKTSPRSVAETLPAWIESLVESKDFEDLYSFTSAAIAERPHDIALVSAAQRARVIALMAEGKFDLALQEGKSYFNVCTLKATGEAVGFLAAALERVDATKASRFKTFQSLTANATSTASNLDDILPEGSGNNSEEPVSVINVDPTLAQIPFSASIYDASIADLATKRGAGGQYSRTNFIARGNLLLLSNKPAEAKSCFESALKMEAPNSKATREAFEGIARSIKALDGTTRRANQFVLFARAEPGIVAKRLGDIAESLVAQAAQQTAIASVSGVMEPKLELERRARDAKVPADVRSASIDVDFEGCAPATLEKISSSHFVVSLKADGLHNWFMFRLDGVKDQTVRVDIRNGDPGKWFGLNPVYAYASNLADVSLYRVQGSQYSSKREVANNGVVMPNTLGQRWHYIHDTWCVSDTALSLVQTFAEDSVIVAMRVPYTPSYNSQYSEVLSGSDRVKIHTIGSSQQGRPLIMLEIGNGDPTRLPGVLVYAREHGNEQDSSWAAQGLIDFLISDNEGASKLRQRMTFLVVPVLDPDAAAAGVYENMIRTFAAVKPSPEAKTLSQFMAKWVFDKKRIDLVLNLHNIESGERDANIFMPVINIENDRLEPLAAFQNVVGQVMKDGGVLVDPRIPEPKTNARTRLGGWVAAQFGAMHLLYEINSQAPSAHLNLAECRNLGTLLANACDSFFQVDQGKALLAKNDQDRDKVYAKWQVYDAKGLLDTNALTVLEEVGLDGGR